MPSTVSMMPHAAISSTNCQLSGISFCSSHKGIRRCSHYPSSPPSRCIWRTGHQLPGRDHQPSLLWSSVRQGDEADETKSDSDRSLVSTDVTQAEGKWFHSFHKVVRYHGSARTISGGLIYVSDVPGHHSFDLHKKLVLSDGSVF